MKNFFLKPLIFLYIFFLVSACVDKMDENTRLKLNRYQETIDQLEEEVNTLREVVQEKNTQIQESNNQISNLEKEIKQLSSLNDAQTESEKVNILKKSLEQQKKENAQLHKELAKITTQKEGLNEKLASARQQIEKLESGGKSDPDTEKILEKTQAELSKARTEISSLKKRYKEITDIIDTMSFVSTGSALGYYETKDNKKIILDNQGSHQQEDIDRLTFKFNINPFKDQIPKGSEVVLQILPKDRSTVLVTKRVYPNNYQVVATWTKSELSRMYPDRYIIHLRLSGVSNPILGGEFTIN